MRLINSTEVSHRQSIRKFMRWKPYYDGFKDESGRAVYGIDACSRVWDKFKETHEVFHVVFHKLPTDDFNYIEANCTYSCTIYYEIGVSVTYSGRSIEEAAIAATSMVCMMFDS